MKIFNQFLIFVLFLGIIYIANNDYKSIYTKTVSYIESSISDISVLNKNKIGQNIVDAIRSNIKEKKEIDTPGALVATNDYLTLNTQSINLDSKKIIEITNEYRAQNGNLTLLKGNTKLNFSAEKKLQDMFVKQYFEHESPVGIGVDDLGAQVGYEYIMIGENLALGNFKNNRSLVDAWMASEGHRANILNNKYTDIGVATSSGTYNGKNIWMAVQHFGLPKSACPTIDDVLKGIINLNQKDIKIIESELALRRENIDNGVVSKEGFTISGQIDKYNEIIKKYNRIISEIKEKINIYNEQVRNFNECLTEISQ